jgi:hypothetical protein
LATALDINLSNIALVFISVTFATMVHSIPCELLFSVVLT